MRAPPRVYLITDRHATAGRPLPDVVAAALEGVAGRGADVAVQLREKDLGGRALLDLARALRGPTARAGARLFVNDRIDVALAAGADGVHLGGGALPAAEARAVAGPDLEIAVSTHAPAEVAAAAAAGHASFALFGPVFDTPSKRRFGPPLGEAALAAAVAAAASGGAARLPVLALGGIRADNVPRCIAAGATGIACIRAVLAAANPGAALARILEATENT